MKLVLISAGLLLFSGISGFVGFSILCPTSHFRMFSMGPVSSWSNEILVREAKFGISAKSRQESCFILSDRRDLSLRGTFAEMLEDPVLEHCAALALGELGMKDDAKLLAEHLKHSIALNRSAIMSIRKINDKSVKTDLIEIYDAFNPISESGKIDKTELLKTIRSLEF